MHNDQVRSDSQYFRQLFSGHEQVLDLAFAAIFRSGKFCESFLKCQPHAVNGDLQPFWKGMRINAKRGGDLAKLPDDLSRAGIELIMAQAFVRFLIEWWGCDGMLFQEISLDAYRTQIKERIIEPANHSKAVQLIHSTAGRPRETLEALKKIYDQPLLDSSEQPEIKTWRQIIDTKFDPSRFLIDRLLPRGTYLLHATAKTGKSYLAQHLAMAVATGQTAFGNPEWETFPGGHVLYLFLEGGERRMVSRFLDTSFSSEHDPNLHATHQWPKEDALEHLFCAIQKHGYRLIILDTLNRIAPESVGENAGKASDGGYQAFNDWLRPITNKLAELDCSAFLIHHSRKGRDPDHTLNVLGSSGIFAAVDGNIDMRRDRSSQDKDLSVISIAGNDIEDTQLTVRWTGSDAFEFVGMGDQAQPTEGYYGPPGNEPEPKPRPPSHTALIMSALFDGPKTYSELEDITGIAYGTLRSRIADLKREEKIKSVEKGRFDRV